VSEQTQNPFEPFFEEIRRIIRQEIRAVIVQNEHGPDNSHETSKPYLTVKEAAEVSRFGPSTIRLAIRRRQLKALQVGSRIIIKRADLERYLEANPIEAIPN